MKILQTQTLRGPNYWSLSRSKLIIVRLDLEDLADRPSDTISGFYAGLVAALPSLEEHFCSPGCRGGFLSRVREGTMMGHILEHVALELQTLADIVWVNLIGTIDRNPTRTEISRRSEITDLPRFENSIDR